MDKELAKLVVAMERIATALERIAAVQEL